MAFFHSLAHTLCNRRSLFPWRAAAVATSVSQLRDRLRSITFSRYEKKPKLAFVFTDQGTQWPTMGKQLWDHNAVFRDSIAKAEKCLRNLKVNWKLTDEIWKSHDVINLSSAVIAQPACTAIQLGLVDLLASWNIYPSAVIGHSSGEIAAAYACKAISFHDAILVAYVRGCAAGRVAGDQSIHGAMMTVGLGPHTVQPYIAATSKGQCMSAIACINSPDAVTVSGDKTAIDALESKLQQQGVFSRQLPVDVAYHSRHMLRVADIYRHSLATMQPAHSDTSVPFYSTVTGTISAGIELGPQYWTRNLVSPVLFSNTIEKLISTVEPDMLIEIGPHAALKESIERILEANGKEVLYFSTLTRNQPADQTMAELASRLFTHSADIDIGKVNFPSDSPQNWPCLSDLPPYPWDHSHVFSHD